MRQIITDTIQKELGTNVSLATEKELLRLLDEEGGDEWLATALDSDIVEMINNILDDNLRDCDNCGKSDFYDCMYDPNVDGELVFCGLDCDSEYAQNRYTEND